VEGLIVLVVSSLLVTLVFKYQVLQNKEYDIQGQISFLQKDVRSAMETLENDIRMAGSGFPKSALAGTITLINGVGESQTQGGSSVAPDEIVVLNGADGVRCVLTDSTANPLAPLKCDDVSRFTLGWALIADVAGSELFMITDIEESASKLHHTTALSRNYRAGSQVLMAQYRHYSIDAQTDADHPRLVAKDWDGTEWIIAENIEDIQFTYLLDNHTETTVQPADVDDLVMVRVNIVGRTERSDADFNEDGYRRRELSSKVQLRNFHLRKGI
jgi:hypothetical protein